MYDGDLMCLRRFSGAAASVSGRGLAGAQPSGDAVEDPPPSAWTTTVVSRAQVDWLSARHCCSVLAGAPRIARIVRDACVSLIPVLLCTNTPNIRVIQLARRLPWPPTPHLLMLGTTVLNHISTRRCMYLVPPTFPGKNQGARCRGKPFGP